MDVSIVLMQENNSKYQDKFDHFMNLIIEPPKVLKIPDFEKLFNDNYLLLILIYYL